MQRSDRFSVNSLIDHRSRDSLSSDAEDTQELSAAEDEANQETRHAVTSFTVKDILDPHKFNALRRRSSESDSDSESLGKEDARDNSSWHPWMAAARLNRVQKANGKSNADTVLKQPSVYCFIDLPLQIQLIQLWKLHF